MPAVISNTSPIQYLYQTDTVSLLPELFGTVCVPGAVVAELETGLARSVPLPNACHLPWLDVRPVKEPALLPLVNRLGDGEREVLALGLESPGALLLLDDLDARRQASALGLKVSGTLGVLLLAKERGKLDSVRPVVDKLDRLGFRLGPTTRETVLQMAGESD